MIKLIGKFDNCEYMITSPVIEFNKATGRKRSGWQIFQIIEQGGSAAIGIRRPCPHIDSQAGECNHDWCPKSYRKWVTPSSLDLRVVRVLENA